MKPVVATFAIMAMLLTYNATTTIANTSVSGDILYPVKTAKEKVQIAFTFDKEDKIKLQMTFISRRTEELHKIALNGSDSTKTQDQIENTAKKIAEDVKTVQDGLNKITIASINENNDSAIELAKEIDTKTLEVKKSINLCL